MKTFKKAILASAIALPALQLSGNAVAAPVFAHNALNGIFFQNVENQYRLTTNCVADACLPADANSPAGYQLVNPGVVNNALVGDIFAGIFNVQNIDNQTAGGTVWNAAATDQFTGYFAQEITNVQIDLHGAVAGGVNDHLTLGNATADPFGILAAGEMFRLYVDDAGQPGGFQSGYNTIAGGSILASIGSAIDGTFWGSLGLTDGYAYSHVALDASIFDNTAGQEAFVAVDLITQGAAYNAGNLSPINDATEGELGGVAPNPTIGTCVPLPMTAADCNDVVGTSEIEGNTGSQYDPLNTGLSPWIISSNDPFQLYVPEPGTLALFGLSALGLAGMRRRKMR